jgi:hypothetical protein
MQHKVSVDSQDSQSTNVEFAFLTSKNAVCPETPRFRGGFAIQDNGKRSAHLSELLSISISNASHNSIQGRNPSS